MYFIYFLSRIKSIWNLVYPLEPTIALDRRGSGNRSAPVVQTTHIIFILHFKMAKVKVDEIVVSLAARAM